ncbi:MAG: hypothetical protein J3R72DRAFT_431112 [Linnemannia gamsii]|nr:MAG: hypothetical protein J3R72DRAFT_431112 [Linnemannia gamsii]
MKQLLHSIPLAPGHFLPRLLWTTALCLEVCKELEGAFDPSLPSQDKIQDLKATCLDIFLASVVHRNEPRFPHNTNPSPSATSSTTTHDHLNEDLENCLVLFCLLFPVHKESTWTLFHQPQNTSANDSHARPQPSVYSVFLTRLFEHLLPLLERVDQRSSSSDSTSSSALILAGVTFSLLAFQLPSRTVYNDRAQISKALKDISDLQRDSSLMSTSTLWRHMFGRMSLSNPFDVLESRLATVQ